MSPNYGKAPVLPLGRNVDPDVKRSFQMLAEWVNELSLGGHGLIEALSAAGLGGGTGTTSGLTPTSPGIAKGLVVNGAYATINLTWDESPSEVFSYTEVWRGVGETDPGLETAILVGTTSAYAFNDLPPNKSTSVVYWYWIRHVSTSSIAGPFNQTSGTSGQTATDPVYALENLVKQIGYESFDVASGVFPVRIGTTLPTLPDAANWPAGSTFFKTNDGANGKLYKTKDGAVWNSKTEAGDIAGQIVGTQISNGSISTEKIVANAITSDELSANAVIAGKIAAGAVIASHVGTNEIIANTANVKNGVITNAKIADLSADKITAGTITATIGLTAPNISGGTISGNAITGGTISGATITGGVVQTSDGRTKISSDVLTVIDASGVTRVKLGKLS